jgi:ribonucleoside-triphosphate reductase (thioredoxin)
MSIKALSDYTFVAKYARYMPDKKRRETYKESVERVRSMMHKQYADKDEETHQMIDWAYDMMLKKKGLGSQRALQFGGDPIFKHNARMFNCVVSYADRARFFQECMYMLLCGCGVGFSVQYRHNERLPDLIKEKSGSVKYTIPDTIEGWSDAVGILVTSYFQEDEPEFPDYKGKNINFVFDKIRPKGSRISNGGKAPGPEPLKKALNNIKNILDNSLLRGDGRLKPIEVYDIVMHTADAVISGGVRRSATICLFSPEDEEMATAKTGNWFNDNPQRGRSNNSALLLRNKTSKEQFSKLMKSVKEFGEPGFVWADHEDFIVNPCVEIGMYPVDVETGKSGWQGCNLSTVNCAKVSTEEEFYDAVRAVTIIGTLQAGFCSFPYLGETSEKIFRRESLLGVSGTGWFEKPEICLDPTIQKKAAELAKKTNKLVAEKIGIPQAARVTCVKPEGTASCILGTASGIHPHHAKRYIRRVQANKLEAIYQHFKKVNPRACEESVWSANRTDDVISFCVEVPDGSKTKNQVTAIELLKTVRSTQQNWVIPGTNPELCTAKWLVHNVSNTINVKPNEWEDVENFIYDNREFFCGISLLPVTGDKDYPQAPFTTVYLPSKMVGHYGDGVMFASGLIEVALNLWEDNLWAACDSLLGFGSPVKGKAKESWVARCKKFAEKYFEGDIKQLTYCMKDIYNFKLWTELKREYKNVDYTEVVEEYDDTQLEQAMACGANGCEII